MGNPVDVQRLFAWGTPVGCVSEMEVQVESAAFQSFDSFVAIAKNGEKTIWLVKVGVGRDAKSVLPVG